MGETHFATNSVILMGVVLLLSGAAYSILTASLITANGGRESTLAKAVGRDYKGNISLVGYTVAIIVACWLPAISYIIFALIAIMWLIPDRRIENVL